MKKFLSLSGFRTPVFPVELFFSSAVDNWIKCPHPKLSGTKTSVTIAFDRDGQTGGEWVCFEKMF
jgi:hypothetical protein